MAGFFDNWGRPQGSSPGMAAGFPMDMGLTSGAGSTFPWGDGMPGQMPVPDVSSGIGKIPGVGIGLPGSKLGLNFDTANLAMSGLSTIGGLWAAFQAQKLAKQQFKYTKGVTDTNLANQIQTYNTGLTDRANNRAIVEGRSPEQTKSYIDANALKRYGV